MFQQESRYHIHNSVSLHRNLKPNYIRKMIVSKRLVGGIVKNIWNILKTLYILCAYLLM